MVGRVAISAAPMHASGSQPVTAMPVAIPGHEATPRSRMPGFTRERGMRRGIVRAAGAVAIATAMVLATGCGSDSSEASGKAQPRNPSPQAVIDELSAYAEPLIERWRVPAVAIGLITEDGLVAERYFGRNAAGGPLSASTLFEIGSATKAFLGVTEAILVDQGRLDWNDRVVDHYPEFALSDPWVTREFRIVDLISQRSGLPPYSADLIGDLGHPYEDAIKVLKDIKPVSSFRSEFAYQNIPHLVAGKIVAAKTGEKIWGDAARKLIFAPLGMTSTSVSATALTSSENSTRGHEVVDGKPRELAPARFPADAQGAGGITSNLHDMARWVRMHLARGDTPDGRFLPAERLEETYRPRVPITGEFADGMKQGDGPPQMGYATGWMVHSLPEGRVIDHGGTTHGFTSAVRFDPDRRIGVVVLTNLSHKGGLAAPISQYAIDLIQGRTPIDYEARVQAAVAKQEREKRQRHERAATKPRALEHYTGVYEHPVVGKVTLRTEGDALRTVIGPKRADGTFEREPDGTFTLRWQFDGDPRSWHLSAPVTFAPEGARPRTMTIGDLEFVRRRG